MQEASRRWVFGARNEQGRPHGEWRWWFESGVDVQKWGNGVPGDDVVEETMVAPVYNVNLSATGGIVNAYGAIREAQERSR